MNSSFNGLRDSESEEDVWHLRQSQPRNQQTTGDQTAANELTQETQSLSASTEANISLDATDNPTEISRPPGPEEFGVKSSIFSNLKNTLSSVFQTSSTKACSDVLVCTVTLLDGRSVPFTLSTKNALGRDLLLQVTSYQNLEQTDLFGLTYSIGSQKPGPPRPLPSESDEVVGSVPEHDLPCETNPTSPINQFHPNGCTLNPTWPVAYNVQQHSELPTSSTARRQRRSTLSYSTWIGHLWSRSHTYVGDVSFWLAMDKRISEQCRGLPYIFQFQVKYYIPHPDRDIYCDEARRQYCLQLRQHLLSGRLPCSFNTHVLLGAYISQFVLGDAHPQHSGLDDTCSRSLRSSFSSKRCSHKVSDSVSEAPSLISDRACSLAEPELSDVDNENCDPNDRQSITWIQPESIGNGTRERELKSATLGHVDETQPPRLSIDFSRTCRSESARTTYLSVLPHLNRLSRSSSFHRSAGFHTTLDDYHSQPDDCASLDFTDPGLESSGANWPYPDPTGYFCPEMLRRIARLHRRIRGMPRSRAECRFLHEVKKLSMYGVELHLVKRVRIEQRSTLAVRRLNKLYRSLTSLRRSRVWQTVSHREATALTDSLQRGNVLSAPHSDLRFQSLVPDALPFDFNSYSEFAFSAGVCNTGLMLYWGQVRVARFPWTHIVEISLQRQSFILTVRETDTDSRRSTICFTFVFSSSKLAARFYSSCVDHHKYFRLGAGRSRTIQEDCVNTPAVAVVAPTPMAEPSDSVSPQIPPTRTTETRQHARIRQWLTCLIPRAADRPPSSNRRRTRPLQNSRERSPVAHPSSNSEQPATETGSPAAIGSADQSALQPTLTEPWLRRDCGPPPPMEPRSTDGAAAMDTSLHTASGCIEVDQVHPTRISWLAGSSNEFRSDESPIVPNVRRVQSAVSGTQRDLIHRASPSVTRPVSFSAMHKRAVSGRRPPPPPRPKAPPTPLLSNTSSVLTDSVNRNVLQNLSNIPIVPTFTAVFTPDGRLVRTMGHDLSVSVEESQAVAVSSDLRATDELARFASAPQTSTPIPTKRFLIATSIPIVSTRSVRLKFSPSQINCYQILDSVATQYVNGLCVPLVPTKSVFMRYE